MTENLAQQFSTVVQLPELRHIHSETFVLLMRQFGFILIDTRYAFGLADLGCLHVPDEVATPDSLRLSAAE
eukprot:2976432-Lingulodinium_polyedra.AAC.1